MIGNANINCNIFLLNISFRFLLTNIINSKTNGNAIIAIKYWIIFWKCRERPFEWHRIGVLWKIKNCFYISLKLYCSVELQSSQITLTQASSLSNIALIFAASSLSPVWMIFLPIMYNLVVFIGGFIRYRNFIIYEVWFKILKKHIICCI